jgi:hypothetical protein
MEFINTNSDKPCCWKGLSANSMRGIKQKFITDKLKLCTLIIYKRREELIGSLPMNVVRYTVGFL